MKNFLNSTKKINKVYYYFILFFGICLLLAAFWDISLRQFIYEKNLKKFPVALNVVSYPLLVVKDNMPNITAAAAVVMDNDSKVVLYSKNPNLLFSMASTTKIMTAIVALEYYKDNDILTIQAEDVEGVDVGFKKGQKFFFKDVLYGMLLPSGNDAALALAQNYPGGEEAFVGKMNEKARLLHLYNTHFADPSGLIDSKDYTTVLDLARLASFALENKTFAEVVGTRAATISDILGETKYEITNLNKLLGTNGVVGIKTGYTDEAGQVLVTSRVEDNHTLIIVVMDSEDRFLDTSILMYFVSGNINYLSIRP